MSGQESMEQVVKRFQFAFGPISRTLGEKGDYLGFAPLPVHEAVMALLGARNRDEFIAWLWHDSFKALFIWGLNRYGEPSWLHIPGDLDQANLGPLFDRFAQATGIDSKLARYHHQGSMISEPKTITNEFGALYLGEIARFVQLSLACQPTAHTMPLRQCVTAAFLQAVSQVTAHGIAALNLSFSRVLYSFQPQPDGLTAAQIATQYQLQVVDRTLYVVHWVPSDVFATAQMSIDLTAAPPDRKAPDTLALIELLTMYRDELTTMAAVPLFLGNLDTVVREIRTAMNAMLPKILEQAGIQATHKQAADGLVDVILEQMVEVRPITDSCNEEYEVKRNGNLQKRLGKPIHKLIQRPYQLMADSVRSQVCVVCGSPITQKAAGCYKGAFKLQDQQGVFSGRFTDFEHVGFVGMVCPLCLIYANSDNEGLFRGAQAFLAPSTALSAPVASQLVETPCFDKAGRFDPAKPLPKTAVTLQEMVLLTAISRRIVDALLPFRVESSGQAMGDVQIIKQTDEAGTETPVGVYLPYECIGKFSIYSPPSDSREWCNRSYGLMGSAG
jgi:hypothetical protein